MHALIRPMSETYCWQSRIASGSQAARCCGVHCCAAAGQVANVSARPSSTADAAVIGRRFGWALRMSIIALHLEIMYFASSTASWRAPAGVPFRRLLDDFLQCFDCDHGTVLSVAFRPRAPVRAFA